MLRLILALCGSLLLCCGLLWRRLLWLGGCGVGRLWFLGLLLRLLSIWCGRVSLRRSLVVRSGCFSLMLCCGGFNWFAFCALGCVDPSLIYRLSLWLIPPFVSV